MKPVSCKSVCCKDSVRFRLVAIEMNKGVEKEIFESVCELCNEPCVYLCLDTENTNSRDVTNLNNKGK